MPEENFLLVSLKDSEAKRLAQVISNDTSRKIIDFLASRKDATESDIAKHMNLPLSTVHYNLHALLQAKLVQADEFHYSEKGKEVNHYSLANKYVIIAPKDAPESLKMKLRRILPAAFITVAAAALLQTYDLWVNRARDAAAVLPRAAPMMIKATAEAADQAAGAALTAAATPWWQTTPFWFLYGAVFTLMVVVAVDWMRKR
jgi:DNA-binding transcriptional ArsR family regulator